MATPLERLTRILNSHKPAVVRFKSNPLFSKDHSILLEHVIVTEAEKIPPEDDKELYELLKGNVNDTWHAEQEKYIVTATVESLWRGIISDLTHKYSDTSLRCVATKRKTVAFIEKIAVDDKLLSEFVLQTFIKVQSSSYKSVAKKDRETLFEQFDSLRRTFGKRVW